MDLTHLTNKILNRWKEWILSWLFVQPTGPITGSTILSDPYYILYVDATAGDITITLPLAITSYTKPINIKRTDNSQYILTIDCQGGENIEQESSIVLLGYECATLMSDKTNYWII